MNVLRSKGIRVLAQVGDIDLINFGFQRRKRTEEAGEWELPGEYEEDWNVYTVSLQYDGIN